MKILITSSPWLGGSGTVGIRLAEELAKKHQVFFLSFDFPSSENVGSKNLVFYSLTTFSYALFSYPLYTESLAEKMFDLVKKNDIDIIHAHYSLVFGTSAILAKRFLKNQGKEIPVIVTMHGTDAMGFDPTDGEHYEFDNLNSFLVEEADHVSTASSYMYDFVMRKYGREDKMSIIPNFIDTKKYENSSSESYESRNLLVHISNFRKVKRPILVEKAFKRLYEKGETEKLRFLFVGDGPLREDVENYVSEQGLPNVTFTGKKNEEEIIEILKKSRAIFLSSEFENFPLVLLEAMAMGVPQIATYVGGIKDVIDDVRTGYLIDSSGDIPSKMAEAFVVLNKKNNWTKMSLASIERSKKFDSALVIDKYENLYKKELLAVSLRKDEVI